MTETQTGETFGFQTEARQLLKLMIHSLYSNREIFLRELISNASDAIDKRRFRAISDPALVPEGDYRIRLIPDSENRILRIVDNGIGMTRQEVIDNLGTIARSGTAEFLQQLTGDQKKDTHLIGQFGVGFYSAFIVADRVEVITRSVTAEPGVRWESRGEDDYSLFDAPEAAVGTEVVLHLRPDAAEFAEDFRLRALVRKYSDHIGVPVEMPETSSADEEEQAAEAAPAFAAVNSAQALWTRPRNDISDEEYREFYKHVSHDFEDPLRWSHNRVEGKLEYTSLLYIPKHAPFDLWNRDAARGLKLYVQRVYIMDDAEQFLPLYLRFVKGVVDCSDLPLNVSREILQQDDKVSSIRNALTKRVLKELESLSKDSPEDYQSFWDEFGEVLKEGVGEDFTNRETLLGLLRFSSTTATDGGKTVALADYLERMVDGQDSIYYLIGDRYDRVRLSPHLEAFKARGIEVLLLHDRIDEWFMSSVTEFQGKAFQDVLRGDLALPKGTGDGQPEQPPAEDAALTERLQSILADQVEAVRPSSRLSQSPACLVLSDQALGPQMRRIMEAAGQSVPPDKPIFEYNPGHPLLERLAEEQDEARFAELTRVLFDQAALAAGSELGNPAEFAERLNRLLLELLSD